MCRAYRNLEVKGALPERPFRILAVNVNSLIRTERRANLFQLLKDQSPDVFMASETKLSQKHKLTHNNYNIVRKDRPNSTLGGGVAIFVRKGINYKVIYNSEVRRFRLLEACIVCIPLQHGKRMYVIAVYAPESPHPTDFLTELEKLFQCLQLNSLENYYLMAGDFNAKHIDWGNQIQNPRGNHLFNWVGQYNIEYMLDLLATDRPSFPRSGAYLDLLLKDSRLTITDTVGQRPRNCLRTIEYDSDHCGLAAVIQLPNELVELEEYVPAHSYNYSKMRWPRFTNALSREIRSNNISPPNDRNLTNSEIDQYLERMDETILRTMNRTIPKYKERNETDMYRNATIDALHRQKSGLLTRLKLLYRRFTNSNDLEIRTLKSSIKNINQLIKENYRLSINLYWNNKIRAVNSSDPSMFPQINKIFRRNDQNELPCLKLQRTTENRDVLLTAGIDPEDAVLDDDLFIVEDPQEKVEAVGAAFQQVYKVNACIRPNHDLENRALLHHFYLRNDISQWRSENLGFTGFNEENLANAIVAERNGSNSLLVTKVELQLIFESLKKKKSAGVDGISNIVLRHLPQEAIDIYVTLFNNALNNAYYPVRWKTAVVHPLPKKGKDNSNPANLRSISLLPSISKVFEKVINRALSNWAEDNNIIPDNQFGFKAGHDTIHAASKLVSDVQWNKSKRQCTGACLVDLEKAFDTVWLEGLYLKLTRLGISKPLLYMLYDMLNGRKFVVKSGNVTSTAVFDIKNGLQQGAVNSPILFSIYTSDLIGSLTQAIAYADDLIAYRTATTVEVIRILLQRDFDKIQRYCDDWKLKINFQKSETILFRTPLAGAPRDTRKNWRKLVIVGPHGHPLASKSVVKYLGIWMDQYLYFDRHINAALSRARGAFALTKRLFYSSRLDSRVKVICYMALIRPMIAYGCPVWFNVAPSQMEKIRVFERQCLRHCLGLHRTPESEYRHYYSNQVLYNGANINRIDNFLLKLIRGHIARAMSSANSLIFGAYYPNTEYFEGVRLSGYIPPNAFLYLDSRGLIQDREAVPLIYHVGRRAVDRRLRYNRDVLAQGGAEQLRFSRTVSDRDRRDRKRQENQFWWLNSEF